jgi:hypothetical protein
MAKGNKSAGVATYGDHEVITPDHTLRKMIKPGGGDSDDPVARAEQALAELSTEFSSWMDAECARLDRARHDIVSGGFTTTRKESLFIASHDIKGEAATFGFPLVAVAANSLCRLLEFSPDASRIPIELVNQHVDAVRAIYREYSRSDAKELAGALGKRLRQVADEFLVRENRGRPEVLEQVMSPSIVP